MQEWMITWGPIVSAFVAGIFTLIGAYLQISKPGNPSPVIAILSLVFIIIGISATWFLWEPKNQWDQWDIWSDKITKYVSNCVDKGDQDIYCVQHGLERYVSSIPSANTYNAASSHYQTTKAGEILINIKPVQEVFNKYFGIKPATFLGTGTVTLGENKYKNLQAREYLIPNLHDTHPHVWTWKFAPTQEFAMREMTVKEFIEKIPPDARSNVVNDIANAKKSLHKMLYNPMGQPPVIRFQKFPESKYKGTVGRPEAYRVFAINLADVINLKLGEAMEASGFPPVMNGSKIDTDIKYFVWLFIPFHDGEVEPATWKNVIEKSSVWLKEGKYNADY